jgi:hypothetical protein
MLQQKRADAIWRLAGDVSLDDRAFVHGVLGLASALLVPGQAFVATFGRVLGARIAVECVNDDRIDPALRVRSAGIARATAAHAEAIRRLVTLHWDDAGAGALLVTPFNAGHALYVVAFAANERALRPFTADDDAFAESVASLIAARVQTRWDAVAARDPLEVVTL